MQEDTIADYDRLEKEMRKEKEPKAVWKRLFLLPRFIFKAVLASYFLFLAVLVFLMVQQNITGEDPSLWGRQLYIVGSNSMNPALHKGSLLFVQPMDPQNVAAGDIITFQSAAGNGELITHRVVSVHAGEEGLSFTTRGDANEINDTIPVPAQNIIGKVEYYLPAVGYLISFAGTRTGLLSMIIIPAILLIIFELCSLFKIRAQMKKREIKIPIPSLPEQLVEKGNTEIINVEAGAEDAGLPAQIVPLPVKTKGLKKINGQPAGGTANGGTKKRKNSKNNSSRERNANYSGPYNEPATIIMFAHKMVSVPGRNPTAPRGYAQYRHNRFNKVESIGRLSRYLNNKTARPYVRSVSRCIMRRNEKK
ncbi:MAG: signal peptidase I [Firmicutes bacterium]|nr:signal peptidase I [Bacillota bacterium]